MRSAGRKKRPSPSVTRSTTVPLAGCVAVTVAPGSTPPELSLTTPLISPVLICAAATLTDNAKRTAMIPTRLVISLRHA